MITGPYLPSGGKAVVYLDGKQDRAVDVYSDEDQAKFGEAVWHVFGLKNGSHKVRYLVVFRSERFTTGLSGAGTRSSWHPGRGR